MEKTEIMRVYKCPSCGGAVKYDASAGKLVCAWCANEYGPTDLQAKEVETGWRECECPECGATVMAFDFIAADTCPYCGNNEVAVHRFEGEFKPDFVIPFSLTKKKAIASYENAMAQKEYLPDDFIAESRIVSVRGAYVPFWLHSGTVDYDYSYKYEGNVQQRSFAYENHDVGTFAFARVPADASKKMPDIMMDSLEPYSYNGLIPFTTGCLPGFVAERYSVDQQSVMHRVHVRVRNSARHAVEKNAVKDATVRSVCTFEHYANSRDKVTFNQIEQALLPVWLIVVMYKGSKILVGVNGQTGRVRANLPVDEKKSSRALASSAGKGILIAAGIVLAYSLAVLFNLSYEASKHGDTLQTALGALGPMPIVMLLGLFALFAYGLAKVMVKKKKGEVADSMHNVEIAQDANIYDTGNLIVKKHEEREVGWL